MKKVLFLFAALLFTVYAKAQDIVISNNSCQDIMIDVSADISCGQTAQSIPYKIPQKSTLKLSMYPGGSYPEVDWSAMGPVIPGSSYTMIKVYDTPTAPTAIGYLTNYCFSYTPTFVGSGACGTINGSSTWTPSLVTAVIN